MVGSNAQHTCVVYSKIITSVCFILCVDSERPAANWSAEETRGSCQH